MKKKIIGLVLTLFLTEILYAQTEVETEWNWKFISAGGNHTLAIKTDGSLWAWGNNRRGQLGDGTTTNRTTPIRIGTDTNWATVSTGGSHTVAMRTDGTLWAWGWNEHGQLGDGTTTDRHNPVRIGTVWGSVSAGSAHTVAISSDGSLWAWGINNQGQLGDGSTTNRNRPARIGTATNWINVSAGDVHTVGIRRDGSLWAWGRKNSHRMSGFQSISGTVIVYGSTPVRIGADTNWVSVSAGWRHTIAIKTDNTLWAWGDNGLGQLGDSTNIIRDTPVQIGAATNWASVSAGGVHSLAVRTNGTIWTWGSNGDTGWGGDGRLGDGTLNDRNTPIRIGTDTNWESVSAGGNHTVAIRTDGTIWAWGSNGQGSGFSAGTGDGRLGDGTTNNRSSPVQVGIAPNWVPLIVSAGENHTVIIGTGGTLWAWGNNGHGQLGDGAVDSRNRRINRSTTGRIGTNTDWESVSAGANHTVAIKNNGTLWAWGGNAFGQIGDGTTGTGLIENWGRSEPDLSQDRATPVQIGTDTNWVSISAGWRHTVAIKRDGTLWAWGQNSNGQLGDGSRTNRTRPVQIGTDANWVSASASTDGSHTVAIKTDGTLWSWGWNEHNQLGTAWAECCCDMKFSDTPIQVGTDRNWASVSAGARHTVAIKTDGTLWAWGYNSSGQVGDGTTVNRITPVRIGRDNDWITISAGGWHSVAIKRDGSLWAWGNNNGGRVGDGTTTNRNVPTRVIMPTGMVITDISTSRNHTVAIGRDGTLWVWGNEHSNTPVTVLQITIPSNE